MALVYLGSYREVISRIVQVTSFSVSDFKKLPEQLKGSYRSINLELETLYKSCPQIYKVSVTKPKIKYLVVCLEVPSTYCWVRASLLLGYCTFVLDQKSLTTSLYKLQDVLKREERCIETREVQHRAQYIQCVLAPSGCASVFRSRIKHSQN